MRYLKITIDTGFPGASYEDECELPANWDDMSEQEQEKYKDDSCDEAVFNYITASAEVVGQEGTEAP